MSFARTFTRAAAALGIVAMTAVTLPATAHADTSVDQLKKTDPSAFEWAEGVQEVKQGDKLVVPTSIKLNEFELRKDVEASGF